MTEAQLIDAVQTGNTTYQDAIREISGRIPGATQVEVARLNAMQSALTNMEKAGGNLGSVGGLATNGSYLGGFAFAYAQLFSSADLGARLSSVLITLGAKARSWQKQRFARLFSHEWIRRCLSLIHI